MIVTKAEFAELMGVNRSAVTRWVKNGRIEQTERGRIDVEAAKMALQSSESQEPHIQARLAQIGLEKADKPASEATHDTSKQAEAKGRRQAMGGRENESKEDVAMRYKIAMTKEREAKAELAAIELDREAGLLVERAEVDFVLQDIGITIRDLLESVPDRLSASLAGHVGDVNAIHASLQREMHDVLNQMSEHSRRRSAEVLA